MKLLALTLVFALTEALPGWRNGRRYYKSSYRPSRPRQRIVNKLRSYRRNRRHFQESRSAVDHLNDDIIVGPVKAALGVPEISEEIWNENARNRYARNRNAEKEKSAKKRNEKKKDEEATNSSKNTANYRNFVRISPGKTPTTTENPATVRVQPRKTDPVPQKVTDFAEEPECEEPDPTPIVNVETFAPQHGGSNGGFEEEICEEEDEIPAVEPTRALNNYVAETASDVCVDEEEVFIGTI